MSIDEQGRPEPPSSAGELETLLGFLDFLRATLAWKTAGLGDSELRARLSPSTMSLGGILHHLTFVEDFWFNYRLSGKQQAPPWDTVDWDADPDWDWHAADDLDEASIQERWRSAVEQSRTHLRELLTEGDLGTMERRSDPEVNVRWVLVHMLEEYGRHVGHADLLRESIDGRTGQ